MILAGFLLGVLLPLLLIPLAVRHGGRGWLPLAAVPAVLVAWLVPAGTFVDLPWLLLGTRLGMDFPGRIFLAFTALVWLLAGLSSAFGAPGDEHAGRFRVFYLLAMSGNFGLILAHDLVSFYLGFALMSLAAYGLVVHDGTATVRRAGRVYLVLALVGEVTLFAGLLLLYQRTGTLAPAGPELAGSGPLELALLVLAFGIKAGLPGLHVWLPLAHPAAPIPASAVLSGAMIKAGLLGWLRYLPLGQEGLPVLGNGFLLAGSLATLGAVAVGLVQRDPKVVLAYSSIAKMGTMTIGVGIAALMPALAPAAVGAVAIYAAHHGLAKGALFLGVGVVKSSTGRWPLLVLLIPALVLAGAPLTSGALAKAELKQVLSGMPADTLQWLSWGLLLATTGTTLLMLRFLLLLWHPVDASPIRQPALPWLGLVLASLGLPLLLGGFRLSLADLWPLLAGLMLALLGRRTPGLRWASGVGRIPPGDLLVPVLAIGRGPWRGLQALLRASASPPWQRAGEARAWLAILVQRLQDFEQGLRISTAGTLWLALGLLMVLLLMLE